MSTIEQEVETYLARAEPEVEVLLAEVAGPGTLRVFVDHPAGVTLELCERVTRALAPLRETYALEVSSPGAERPLTKPAHYRRFLGRRARIRTRRGPAAGAGSRPQRRSYTGELVGASECEVTVAAPDGVVSIPYAAIHRSHLLGD
jgi:ribosome maturation factor RimP